MKGWDLSFISSTKTTHECCPECAYEIEILCDGTTTCPNCGHKEVLPCSECGLDEVNGGKCDWVEDARCTPFLRT